MDSPLEGDGFEPSVPGEGKLRSRELHVWPLPAALRGDPKPARADLLMTFSRRAAAEMTRRVERIARQVIGNSAGDPWPMRWPGQARSGSGAEGAGGKGRMSGQLFVLFWSITFGAVDNGIFRIIWSMFAWQHHFLWA
jgi:hypothetical protein